MPSAYRLLEQGFAEQHMLSVNEFGPEHPKIPCVLLVEDEVLIRANLAEELRDVHFRVIEAANAEEAWFYLQSGNRPDLVFSDVRMPGSYDGVELALRIQTEFPDIKIILTSGNLGLTQKPEGVLFLPKPYRLEHAVLTAKRYLGLDECP
jgi:CheY-like chemotaxis protein